MYDAIVVFGGNVSPNGELTPDTQARVKLAVERWQQRLAPIIIFCGRWSFSKAEPPAKTEAAAMAEYAIQLGYPTKQILKEEKSTDTLGNAYFTKKDFVEKLGWNKLLIVVADYHVNRTRYICQRVFGAGVEVTVEGAPLNLSALQRENLRRHEIVSQAIFEDWSNDIKDGDDQAIWDMMNTVHPGYAINSKYSVQDVQQLFKQKEQEIFPTESRPHPPIT